MPRAQRLLHLTAFREELEGRPGPGRLEALLQATRGSQALEAERALLERLPDCFAAYRALPPADAARVFNRRYRNGDADGDHHSGGIVQAA